MMVQQTTTVGFFLLACTCMHTPITTDPAGASTDKDRPRAVERRLSRRGRPAENVRIHATLWDPALLAADATGKLSELQVTLPEPPHEVEERLLRWQSHYVDDQTSFTVLVELLNRPAMQSDGRDPIVDPSKWKFRLDLNDMEDIEPSRVEVQALDRYPSRAKGWHWRLAFAVHFPLDLPEVARARALGKTGGSTRALLRVLPPHGDGTRPEYGIYATRHGFQLTWRLEPASPRRGAPSGNKAGNSTRGGNKSVKSVRRPAKAG